MKSHYRLLSFMLLLLFGSQHFATAQQSGVAGTIQGTVTDPTGAVVTGATIDVRNPISGFERTTATDNSGKFNIPNVPFNPYHLTITDSGFAPFTQDVDVRSVVPVTLTVGLNIAG